MPSLPLALIVVIGSGVGSGLSADSARSFVHLSAIKSMRGRVLGLHLMSRKLGFLLTAPLLTTAAVWWGGRVPAVVGGASRDLLRRFNYRAAIAGGTSQRRAVRLVGAGRADAGAWRARAGSDWSRDLVALIAAPDIGVLARLESAPKLRWNASDMAAGNAWKAMLHGVHDEIEALAAGEPARVLDEWIAQLEDVLIAVDTLIVEAPARGPPASDRAGSRVSTHVARAERTTPVPVADRGGRLLAWAARTVGRVVATASRPALLRRAGAAGELETPSSRRLRRPAPDRRRS